MPNLLNLTGFDTTLPPEDLISSVVSAAAYNPLLANLKYMAANNGEKHTTSHMQETSAMNVHIAGKERESVGIEGRKLLEFYCGRFSKDLAMNAEEYELMLEITQRARKSGGVMSSSDETVLTSLLQQMSEQRTARIESVYRELEKIAFQGHENKIVGLMQMLSDVSLNNVVKATDVATGTTNTHSVVALDLTTHVKGLYSPFNPFLVKFGNPERIVHLNTANASPTRKDYYWTKVDINFGMYAIGDLGQDAFGCARIANIQLYKDTNANENTIRDLKVRSALEQTVRKIKKTMSDSSPFVHLFVADDLYQEMLNFYRNSTTYDGVPYRPRLISDIVVETHVDNFTQFGRDTWFPLTPSVIVHSSSGMPTNEVAL